MSPQKARLVMDLIRGQKRRELSHPEVHAEAPRQHIEKVLRSAIAIAEARRRLGAPLDWTCCSWPVFCE